MYPTMFEIGVALILVGVNVALFVWFRGSVAAGSARRMMGMMTHIGLDPGIATGGNPRLAAVMKVSRRRCRKCPREGFCEKWLAGDVEGDNSFCPNARTFGFLVETDVRSR